MSTPIRGRSRRDLESLFVDGTHSGLSDAELLERFRGPRDASSERAFTSLVERHGSMVLHTCRAILGNDHDAQDAFQVTFLVLAKKAGSIRRRETLPGWLHGVACRTAWCARGGRARRRRHEKAVSARARGSTEGATFDDVAATLHEEIDKLSAPARAAVLLCEFEGLSGEQAAARLGCAVGTVKSRLARARERLRKRLEGREAFGAVATLAPSERLIQTATRLALGSSANHPDVMATAALSAWKTSVLRGMLMTKLKIAGTCLIILGVLASGAALVARTQPQPQQVPKAQAETPSKASKGILEGADLVSTLARSRLQMAIKTRDNTERLYTGGSIALATYLDAERRLVDARLDLSDQPKDRITVLRRSLQAMSVFQYKMEHLFKSGQVSEVDVERAKEAWLEAAIRLAEVTTGNRASRTSPSSTTVLDESKLNDLVKLFNKRQLDLELERKLDEPVTLNLAQPTCLEDFLKYIKANSVGWADDGFPIYVDPAGLQQAGVNLATPINLPLFKGTTREAFRRILKPLKLDFEVIDGLLTITSKK